MLKAPSTTTRIAYYNQAYGIYELTISDYVYRACKVIAIFS